MSSFPASSLDRFRIGTSVTPATSATSRCVLRSPHRMLVALGLAKPRWVSHQPVLEMEPLLFFFLFVLVLLGRGELSQKWSSHP